MSKQHYFSSYKSPNICIVPSASVCYPSSPKRPKLEKPVRDNSPQNIDVSFLDDFDIDEIVKCLNDCDDNTQNIARLKNIENNNDILEKVTSKDCSKSSFKINNNNERNELKNRIFERNLLTKSMDNEEIKECVIETTNQNNTNNTFIEKDLKVNNYNENKHNDNLEIIESFPIAKQTNDETYNITNNSPLNNVNSSGNIINNMENNNTDETKEERIKKCLLKTELDLASTNKVPKQFNGDGKTGNKMGCNTVIKNVDNNKCFEETCLQYSDDSKLQNKHNTTPILEGEHIIDKFNTNESIQTKQFHKTHAVSKSFESENLKNIDSSQNINSTVKSQKVIENNKLLLLKNDEAKSEMLLFNNFKTLMSQYLRKEYTMFSLIHTGQYSKIFKCKDAEDKHYALKMLKKKGNGYKEVMWSRIQGDIPKENLLCVYLIAGFSLNNHWCYLTDFYPNNLKDVLKESKKNLHIDTIQELAGQLVGAVTTLRNKNIVHSDINPSHILLDCTNSKLRLCGFDAAYYIEAANLFPYKGTKCYRAPEVILGYSAGFSLDVWSTALVLHEMATGIQLFGGCIGGNVLYKQMCILGDVPPQMLLRSRYRNKYIMGYCFESNRCLRHKYNTVVKGKNKIACTIQGAYYSHWTEGKHQKQISRDMQKIRQFTRLLEQMLVIYPEHRLPIEFAYSNPFIYKVLNN